MIQYYRKYIYGTEYLLYLARIEFSDGKAHASVFLPVQGGQLCIIDPTGMYLTSNTQGSITSKMASTELQQYSDYRSSPITNIFLYDISIIAGSYTVVASGTCEEIAIFLEID